MPNPASTLIGVVEELWRYPVYGELLILPESTIRHTQGAVLALGQQCSGGTGANASTSVRTCGPTDRRSGVNGKCSGLSPGAESLA